MGKHTPGPWTISTAQSDCPYIEGPNRAALGRREDRLSICDLFEDVTPEDSVTIGSWLKPYENAQANANLIASAPELLAESMANLEWMKSFQASFAAGHLAAVTRAILQKRIEATEKAIAKAEGNA